MSHLKLQTKKNINKLCVSVKLKVGCVQFIFYFEYHFCGRVDVKCGIYRLALAIAKPSRAAEGFTDPEAVCASNENCFMSVLARS